MTNNSKTINIFCSHILMSEYIYPLNVKEWSRFSVAAISDRHLVERLLSHKIEPYEILSFSDNDLKTDLEIFIL